MCVYLECAPELRHQAVFRQQQLFRPAQQYVRPCNFPTIDIIIHYENIKKPRNMLRQ